MSTSLLMVTSGMWGCVHIHQVLEEIEPLISQKASNKQKLQQLSSRFYTIIPHDFGRRVPPVIDDEETLRKKFDMLLVSI